MAAALTASLPPSADRRCFRRVAFTDWSASVRLRLRPGRDGSLLNLSRGGACIQVASRLLPGTPVDMQLMVSDWRWNARARVLRCHVSALVQEDGVRYQAALQFDLAIDSEGQDRLNAALLEVAVRGYEVPDVGVPVIPAREGPTRASSLSP
jgi:hypothetical protein